MINEVEPFIISVKKKKIKLVRSPRMSRPVNQSVRCIGLDVDGVAVVFFVVFYLGCLCGFGSVRFYLKVVCIISYHIIQSCGVRCSFRFDRDGAGGERRGGRDGRRTGTGV